MTISLGPAVRFAVYSAVISIVITVLISTGWYAHKFYAASNELAINKGDAIVSSRINDALKVEIDEIDKQKASFNVVSDCDGVTFDSLMQQSNHQRP
jgi:hypothetical protein